MTISELIEVLGDLTDSERAVVAKEARRLTRDAKAKARPAVWRDQTPRPQ